MYIGPNHIGKFELRADSAYYIYIYIYINIYIYIYICNSYIMPRVLYWIYMHRARGEGAYKSNIARVSAI